MACAAVRSLLESMLSRGKEAVVDEDLVIIVGKGLRSNDGVKLLPTIRSLLLDDYGILVEVDNENSGRLIVNANNLRNLIALRSWR